MTSRGLGLDELVLTNMFESSETKQICQRSSVPVQLYSLTRNWPDWSVSTYDLKSDVWKQSANVAEIAYEHEYEVVSVKDQLIFVETRVNASSMRSVNIHTGEEKALKSMPTERKNMSIVLFNNAIFTIGGSTDGSVLRTIGK